MHEEHTGSWKRSYRFTLVATGAVFIKTGLKFALTLMMQRFPGKPQHDPSIWLFFAVPVSSSRFDDLFLSRLDCHWRRTPQSGAEICNRRMMRRFPGKTRHDPSSGHPPFRGLWSGFCLCESGELKHTFPGASIVHQWNFEIPAFSFQGKVDKATVSRHLDGGVCLDDDPPV